MLCSAENWVSEPAALAAEMETDEDEDQDQALEELQVAEAV